MAKNIEPKVGMGATYGYGSDCYPATIIEVSPSGKRLTIQRDEVLVTSGSDQTGDKIYTLLEDPNGATIEYSLRKNNRWYPVGQPIDHRSYGLTIGSRTYYQDPSF